MAEDIWDQYDYTELNVAISMAMRTQADTITEGGTLTVTLPHSEETVDLNVIGVGNIDPDIMSPDEMVDPATQDNQPIPGIVVDMGPLFGNEENNFVALMLNPEESRAPASLEALESYGSHPDQIEEYLQSAENNGGVLPVMEMKFQHGNEEPPEVNSATAADFSAVGMEAMAEVTAPANEVQTNVPVTTFNIEP